MNKQFPYSVTFIGFLVNKRKKNLYKTKTKQNNQLAIIMLKNVN